MKKIYKYDLPLEGEPFIAMPRGARVLSVQEQHGAPRVWALVDPEERMMTKQWFFVIGTGNPIDFELDEESVFLGTFQLHGGALVFHVFYNGEGGAAPAVRVNPG